MRCSDLAIVSLFLSRLGVSEKAVCPVPPRLRAISCRKNLVMNHDKPSELGVPCFQNKPIPSFHVEGLGCASCWRNTKNCA